MVLLTSTMNRGKKGAETAKMRNFRRAELLLLEVQRDILEQRVQELEKNPQSVATGRKLKRDPNGLPLPDRAVGTKRSKPESAATMTVEEMFNHCRRILTQLRKNSNSAPFLAPVDPVALNCPDYFKIVKHPMDFKTITMRLRPAKRLYESPLEFRDAVRQVFKNCSLYNPIGNQIRIMGDRLSESFEDLWARSNIEKMYQRRLETLKRERAAEKGLTEDGNNGRSKKMKTCSPETALKKITQIQNRMEKVLSGVEDKMEIDVDKPLDFWQRRNLSRRLETASLLTISEIMNAVPERESDLSGGSNEMMLDNVPEENLRIMWSSLTSALPSTTENPTESEAKDEPAAPVAEEVNVDKEPEAEEKEETQENDTKSEDVPLKEEDPIAEGEPPTETPEDSQDEPITPTEAIVAAAETPVATAEVPEESKQIDEETVEEVGAKHDVDDAVTPVDQEVIEQQPMDIDEPVDVADKATGNGSVVEKGGDLMQVDMGEDRTEGQEKKMNGTEEIREANDDEPSAVETAATPVNATTETHES